MIIRRAALTDLFVEDGRSAVYAGGKVMVLSELATEILLAVPEDGSATLDDITARVVETFGDPPAPHSAGDLTAQQVRDLSGHQIVVIEDEEAISAAEGESTPAAVAALRQALRTTLHPSETWTLPDDVDPADFLKSVQRHRVTSQLLTAQDRLDLPDQVRALLRAADDDARAASLPLIAELARAVDALAHVGVRVLTIKGLALAAQAWGDPLARGYGDLDLLVAPEDVEAAHEALCAAGWRPSGQSPRPGATWAWRHFLRTDNEISLTSERSTIDLHWYLVPVRSQTPAFEDLWLRRATVMVGDHEIATLSAYDAMTHSAGHTAKDHWRWLRGLLDVARLCADPATWTEATRPHREDQLKTLALVSRMFGVDAPEVALPAIDAAMWREVEQAQTQPERINAGGRIPGLGFLRATAANQRSEATLRDHARQLSSTLLPPWITSNEPSAHAAVAIPRTLAKRGREVGRLWRKAWQRRRTAR